MSAHEKQVLLASVQRKTVGQVLGWWLGSFEKTLGPSWRHQVAPCIYRSDEEQVYLFRLPSLVPAQDTDYLLFYKVSAFSLRRVGNISNEFSFHEYPLDQESHRAEVQAIFSRAATSSGECLGWYKGPWESLSAQEKVACSPAYIKDNTSSSGL